MRSNIRHGLIAAALLFPAPIAAQPAPEPELGTQIVRKCRQSTDDAEVVVCGRPERSPFRLPPSAQRFDPNGPVDSVSRERHRLYEHGAGGIGSCSTVGPGGWTGCSFIMWKDEHEQKDGNAKVGFGSGRRGWDYGRED